LSRLVCPIRFGPVLDLTQYDSLGAALGDALDRWPKEVCLIETDREKEKARLTFGQFKEVALPLAGELQDSAFRGGDRAAIIMTNQSKWLISAYAIFFCGGVLVPLDYKLTPDEQLRLLRHSKASVLVTEYHIWRMLAQSAAFAGHQLKTVLVTEVPANADLFGARRWEDFASKESGERNRQAEELSNKKPGDTQPKFIPRTRKDPACIVYSSGTGGRPKGCVMTHENYLEQCVALTSLYPFGPGVRYLSILPTNHAIDFMVGFIGPFTCGATVVHLRTLRPEYVREAFTRYGIAYVTLVPLILKNLRSGLQARFDALPPVKRKLFDALVAVNKRLTRGRSFPAISRLLLGEVHRAFGGQLRGIFVGGAFTEPATLQFFSDLGIPVANAYGLTEAGTAVTVNDIKSFRADTVGRPLPGMQVRIVNPDADGVGEVSVRSKTVMSHYWDEPELTSETIVDGWLMTGDLGRLDSTGHLQLLGRKKNMIVTEEGKNIYPEDIETVFEGIAVKEFCVFAANYIWPKRTMLGEQLVIVVHPEADQNVEGVCGEINARNRDLLSYKRISGVIVWNRDFPRTASLKIKRNILAEELANLDRSSSVITL